MARWLSIVVGALVALASAGCSLAPANLGPGASCVRSTQCMPGLVCAGSVCTRDLDGFGGTVPVVDSGPVDAPVVELDAPMEDAGPIVMLDAGPLPDAPVVGMDAGPPGMDAGPPPMDAGPPPVDAPAALPDTPPEPPDTPPEPPDAPDEPDAPV